MNQQQARLSALKQQVKRLHRRIAILDQRSNRLSWLRVAVFVIGCVLSVLAFSIFKWWLGVIGAVLTILAFSIVATIHGKVESSINRHKIWLRHATTQVARLTLDWANIPAPFAVVPPQDHPFAIDLDITGERSLYQLLNTAISQGGSQRLAEWLLTTHPNLKLTLERQALVKELTPLSRFRNKLTLKALSFSGNAGHWQARRLVSWLTTGATHKSFRLAFGVSLTLSALTMLLFILNLLALLPSFYWITTLILSIAWFYQQRKERGDLFEDAYFLRDAFAQISSVFTYLESYPYGKNYRLKKLCQPFFSDARCRPSTVLKGLSRLAGAATLEKNQVLWLIINAIVPWDTFIAQRLQRYKALLFSHLPDWLDAWFELEALCSLANFAYLNPDYTLPEVTAPAAQDQRPLLFRAQDLGHPLISQEVRIVNDFAMCERGGIAIFTGSNMSGKSTFLRTLGVNLCLAFAGGPVNASLLQTSLFRTFTCIRVSDSVTEGYSYFYAEVKRLKALLSELERDDPIPIPLFILIDEIFKGTNNRERLLGSQSYIEALVGRNCTGAISTHDLELVKLADILPKISNYHFREEVIDGRMVFDYILRDGPCPTTNALKIMQLEGLPVKDSVFYPGHD